MAIPVATFVVLHWLVHMPLVTEPVINPAVAVSAATAVLLLPLAAPRTGVAAVIAALAGVCVLVTTVTVIAKAASH